MQLRPHPGHAEFFAGRTIARFARKAIRVLQVVATDGGGMVESILSTHNSPAGGLDFTAVPNG